MHALHLNKEENEQIDRLLNTLLERYSSPCQEAFLLMASTYAVYLPERILAAVSKFRHHDDHDGTF
ncbi:MAG TPA: hypothetical protein VEB42_08435, partial [Chitinophagaceae bacterium]|nr:hypothetical protein [Chitinophagaceae bacterium]